MAWDQNQHEIGQWIKAWMDKHPDDRQSMEHKTYDWFGHEIVSDDDSHSTVGKPNPQDVLAMRSDFKEIKASIRCPLVGARSCFSKL